MIILGQALNGAGLMFISAKATHRADGSSVAAVVCETQEQCDVVVAWNERERWGTITTRVATEEEVAEWRKWQELA